MKWFFGISVVRQEIRGVGQASPAQYPPISFQINRDSYLLGFVSNSPDSYASTGLVPLEEGAEELQQRQ
jgi:hypothetical protein